jgi:hypothetical protein
LLFRSLISRWFSSMKRAWPRSRMLLYR